MQSPAVVKMTPMMEQWHSAKKIEPNAILLFRMGDFYELFGDDALIAAPLLDLTLTSRDKDKTGIKMAGFPFHAADAYVEKLIHEGHRVAICEQLEDPKLAKGVVKRGITQVITPGTALSNEHVPHHEPSFLLALISDKTTVALSVIDLSSAYFKVTSSKNIDLIILEAKRLMPREIVVYIDDQAAFSIAQQIKDACASKFSVRIEKRERIEHSATQQSNNISLSKMEYETTCLVLSYLMELKGQGLSYIPSPQRYLVSDHLLLDDATRANLSLIPKMKGDTHNLFSVLNHTKTAMGRRLLGNAILAPSTKKTIIDERLSLVEDFVSNAAAHQSQREQLGYVHDLEKLVALTSSTKISPRGLAQLRDSLNVMATLCDPRAYESAPHKQRLMASMPDLSVVRAELNQSLVDEPPLFAKDGQVFREGYDTKLDELVHLVTHSKDLMLELETRERAATRISSLKIKFTRVFGYYIEITKTHLSKVPAHYQRKQTIANGERFVTAELADLEQRLNTAEDEALSLTAVKLEALRQVVMAHAQAILDAASLIALFDLCQSFAHSAMQRSLVKPEVVDAELRISQIAMGRHPIIEEICLNAGHYFVPNTTKLDAVEQSLLLITGPNMAGKSTIMRTVALVQIMAQIGCYVPATSAMLSICDALFARVGASDDLSTGRSTFMVEMTETAAILSNATKNSLIILDEIGRGTSTFDGLSLAQAIAEYIHDHLRARTLFATHYHELIELDKTLPRLKNFHVGVEEGAELRFLYNLRPGPCQKSFGIEVAKLSGLPKQVLDRATIILTSLESPASKQPLQKSLHQLSFFSVEDRPVAPVNDVVDAIAAVDLNRITPLQALNKLASWQTTLKNRRNSANLAERN